MNGLIRSGLVLLIPLFASASALPVVNPSFEALPNGGFTNVNGPCGTGCLYSIGLPIPGWNSTYDGDSGQLQPGTQDGNTSVFTALDDGITSAWSRGATLSQTVDAVVQAGMQYLLQVDIGWRNDRGFYGSADLLVNGQRYAATGAIPVQGYWSTFTAEYIGTAADAGSAITIELSANGRQGNFDNVRLIDPPAVPEPALGYIVGIVLIGLAGYNRWTRASRPVRIP